jgi:DNA-binding winged helix-turn-helix (wHTH) protein
MRFRFGRYELDGEARLLRHEGQEVTITPKALQLLELLVARRPAVVAKPAILEALWPETYVAEANIPNLINELRKILGDSARRSKYIRTVHGSGYSFAAAAFEYSAPAPPKILLPTSCSLVGQGWMIPLAEGEHVVGRGGDCEVQLTSAAVSRRHARIRIDGNTAVIEDLRSRNGTYVRDRRIQQPATLEDGDRVRIGDISLRFCVFDPSRTTTRIPLPHRVPNASAERAGKPRRILSRP